MNQTWLEISKSALLNNIAEIKKNLSQTTQFMAVVKANAYGHGLFEVVNQIKEDVDCLAVYSFEDAIALRKNKMTQPILVLGRIFPQQMLTAIEYDIEITVSTLDILEESQNIFGENKLKIHLCMDTGLGRDGFVCKDMEKVLPILESKNLEVKGLYAHFSAADESAFNAYTKQQIDTLLKWKERLLNSGFNPLTHHSASAGTFISDLKNTFDIARVGISLYGLWPSKELQNKYQNEMNLKPALSWKAIISEVKSLPKGSAISYGCTHVLKQDSTIAIVPIGYYDGIFRCSSNKGMALVNGMKVPQIGRVTMNIIVLDVTDVKEVKAGDVVTIIGSDIGADDWAHWAHTSNYEIVTRINPSLNRKVVA